jgi:hypothetical protein
MRSIIGVVGGLLFALAVLKPTIAAAQEAGAQNEAANTGQDFFKPPRNLFQLMYKYRTAPGSGTGPGSVGTVTTDTVNLRLDHRIDLSQQSLLALSDSMLPIETTPNALARST